MKTWFTADPHFGHARINELANRPFSSVEEMNETLVDNFNSACGPKDRLVILGDVCMGKLDESLAVLGKLKAGEIVLVPGNHDRWSLAYEHRGDAEVKREAFRLRYEAARLGIVALADSAPSVWLWPMLCPEVKSHEDPLNRAIFSHYPYVGDSHGEDRYDFLRAPEADGPIIHGHVHEEWRIRAGMFNVGVDVNEFMPVSEEELADWVTSL